MAGRVQERGDAFKLFQTLESQEPNGLPDKNRDLL